MFERFVTLICLTALLFGGAQAQNLVTNGDFSLGNVGFNSDYSHSPGSLFGAGTYAVGARPSQFHGAFASFGDHTTGNGLMMVVNGGTVANVRLWYQTVNVVENQDYVVSVWLASAHPASPAIMQFTLGGQSIGFSFQAEPNTGQWRQYYGVWRSRVTGPVEVSLINLNTTGFGNDFVIDDIEMIRIGTYADTNGDGCVGDEDITNMVLDFGGPGGVNSGHPTTDVNDDGVVDDADLTDLILNFGIGC